MKIVKYCLFALFASGLFAYAANTVDGPKVKTETPAAPPAAQNSAMKVSPMLLSGSADGIPYGLRVVDVNNKAVRLTWNNPEPVDGYFEDFEGHSDFVINSPGSIGWDYLDLDNEYVVTWAATSFPNQGQKMAYIIMNPSRTSPSVAGRPGFIPYSGDKMLMTFTCNNPSVANNDFIISPALNFSEDFRISFRAKAYTSQYGNERIRVGYSLSDKRPSSFVFVSEDPYLEVDDSDWQLIEYSIPKEAKYVTINCVSKDAFMLLIDDIFIGTNWVRPKAPAANKLVGFNLYRNGTKVNTELLKEVVYTDLVDDYGNYRYSVTAVYADGTESEHSEELDVEVADIRLLPFEDDFSSTVYDASKWSTPIDEDGNPNNWMIDYYTYGLVDYSATYRYSRLKNYSQSLVSRELHTLDPLNTYLRFELRLLNYKTTTGDYLAVELSTDNKNWKEIDTFCSDEGSYEWRVHQYPLKDLLAGANLFYIRFRAYGEEANYIDYWYVDDVKVWNPVWESAEMSVSHGGMPMKQCPVTLTADHGAIIHSETDADGRISFGQIEAGVYKVNIAVPGYNVYSEQWTIGEGDNFWNAVVSAPVLEVEQTGSVADMATESVATREITVRNDGDGVMDWYLSQYMAAGSGDVKNRWEVLDSFNASGDLQSSVAFDGEYYYTTSWFYMNKFYQYDREGNFIDEFSIDGIYYSLYDWAFDGTYFYASDKTNNLFQLDLRNRRLVNTITVDDPELKITHCAYDPVNDQFWVGSFNSLGRIDRDGKVRVAFRNLSEDGSLSMYGSAYDNVTPGGPYLWFSNQNTTELLTLDCVELVQYNLNTRKVVSRHTVEDISGYVPGSDIYGPNYLNGLEATTSLVDGKLALMGILQQSPARIFVYTLAESEDWLNYYPKTGTLAAGESQKITLTYNSKNAENGQNYRSTLKLSTNPELETVEVQAGCDVNSVTTTPRPVGLNAVSEGESDVLLSWQAAEASVSPIGYHVYRDNIRLTSTPVSEPAYRDTYVLRGSYDYTVTAVYAENSKESIPSESARVFVKQGASFYRPLELEASVRLNSEINLTWKDPESYTRVPAELAWHNGKNISSIGTSSAMGYFYGGVLWTADDLESYHSMMIDQVEVFIQEQVRALSLKIVKDGNVIYTQQVKSSDVVYGKFNTIILDEPVAIEKGCDYIVSFLIAHDEGLRPLGVDDSVIEPGKGSLFSEDGKNWVPATYQGMAVGNFNITTHLAPADKENILPEGYRIYRNGELISDEPVTELAYSDAVSVPGNYMYEVSAVYENGESAKSESVEAEIIQIGERVAPTLIKADVERNRTIRLHWNYPVSDNFDFPVDLAQMNITCKTGYPEFVHMFRGCVPSELAVCSDGEYIYTSMYKIGGTINKYTLEGEFVESFDVNSAMNGIQNLTYDGAYFYASDVNSCIYKIDMEAKTVVDTLSVSEMARHLTYIPDLDNGKGGFELGDWNTSIYVTKRGAKIGNGVSYKAASGTAYWNGVLYAFEQDHENPYVLAMYDFKTGDLLNSIDLKEYLEISPATGAAAGGMSVITTKRGVHLLALALQELNNTRFIFLDIEGIAGVAGYNVYCNGEKINEELLPFRYFEDIRSEAGIYSYDVETVYIDNQVSGLSQKATVEIVDAGECDVPVSVKARQMSYPYNVNVSFVDPGMLASDVYESSETQDAGSVFERAEWMNVDGRWTVTDQTAYEGNLSLTAEGSDLAWLILPIPSYENGAVLSLVARSEADSIGNGALRILTSNYSSEVTDFMSYTTVTISEAWKQHYFELPASVKYVAIRYEGGEQPVYVDALSVNDEVLDGIYGYDIYRDGVKLNVDPVESVSYTDCNLLPGTYSYQVKAYYNTSCVTELSDPQTIEVDYSNNCQPPVGLTAEQNADGVSLQWKAPALGNSVSLKWHSGTVYDAAGMPNGGSYYAGVQWTPEELAPYAHLSLSEVEVYVNQVPDALFVLIYSGNTLVHQQYVPELRQYSFNTIVLDQPIPVVVSKNLRVVIYVEHNEITVPLGYDEGPAVNGKGNLYSSDGVTWETLADNELDGNWNITVGLRPYAIEEQSSELPSLTPVMAKTSGICVTDGQRLISEPVMKSVTSMRNTFDGYNVYCNGERLNEEPLHVTSFVDETEHDVPYLEYQVTALYSGCGEIGSEYVRLRLVGLEDNHLEHMQIYMEQNYLVISGISKGQSVCLSDVGGGVLHVGISDGNSVYRIPMANLSQGVYIVRVDDHTAKVVLAD